MLICIEIPQVPIQMKTHARPFSTGWAISGKNIKKNNIMKTLFKQYNKIFNGKIRLKM